MQLERQQEELSETLRRQQQYRQSIRDISDRMDQLRCCLDALRLSTQSPLTDDELDDKMRSAEVSRTSLLPYHGLMEMMSSFPFVCFIIFLFMITVTQKGMGEFPEILLISRLRSREELSTCWKLFVTFCLA